MIEVGIFVTLCIVLPCVGFILSLFWGRHR